MGTRSSRRRLLGLLVILWASTGVAGTGVAAQGGSIQGIVAASETGEPLADVTIFLERDGARAAGAHTDRNGFYQLVGIEPGPYTLVGERIGFHRFERAVTVVAGDGQTVSFRLPPAAVEVEGIVVSPDRGAAVRELGRQLVRSVDLRAVPVPAAAGDLAAYLQVLPGVTTTGDRGGQLFVRGGTPAENLVLVDGIPIYQPFHILGFFSAFPEAVVSSADFYAGGFGARYHGRTSSVLDVRLREGDPAGVRATGSLSPFLAEAVVEGPVTGATWLASVRRSLVEEASGTLLPGDQPLRFESQLLKITSTQERDDRCSLLVLRTADRGRLDPDEPESRVAWENLLFGTRCVSLRPNGQLLEVHFGYSSSSGEATSRGASRLRSSLWRVQHDLHVTGRLGPVTVVGGYETYLESMDHDLAELFSRQASDLDAIFSAAAYAEAELPLGRRVEVRPGLVLVASPRPGIEPRLRASWQPFGRSSERLQGAVGLYRQHLVGISDMRDVGSVFVAWMSAPDEEPLEAVHAILGWEQALGAGFRWSLEGYYKRLRQVPVPIWRAVAQFTTGLGRADGEVYGADLRVEYVSPRFYGFVGYGYGWTRYEVSQPEFSSWFGEAVQAYHPPHDRRHQMNAVARWDVAGFGVSARWQLGSGLPFTRPLGFDESFDYATGLHDVHARVGTQRLVLDRPYTARMPAVHRLDLAVERDVDLPVGTLTIRAGAVNAYDRRNVFYYDLFTGRRLDQLSLTPYAALALRTSQRGE